MLKKKHPESDDVRQSLQRLNSKWNELLQASNNRGKGLVELKDILMFNEQVDKVEMWRREKVSTHEVEFVKSEFLIKQFNLSDLSFALRVYNEIPCEASTVYKVIFFPCYS